MRLKRNEEVLDLDPVAMFLRSFSRYGLPHGYVRDWQAYS